jgi:hypothetical protein
VHGLPARAKYVIEQDVCGGGHKVTVVVAAAAAVMVITLLRVMCDVLYQEAAITTDGGVLQWAGEVGQRANAVLWSHLLRRRRLLLIELVMGMIVDVQFFLRHIYTNTGFHFQAAIRDVRCRYTCTLQ